MIRTGKPNFGGLISRSALGIALAFGTVSAGMSLATPAMAAKKDSGGAKLKLSKGFQAVAVEAQKAIEAAKQGGDAADAKAKLEAARAAIENADDRMFFGSLAVGLGGHLKDNAIQRAGLQAMVDSGLADAAQLPRYHYFIGALAYEDKDYASAQKELQTAISLGHTGDNSEALLAESFLGDKKPQQGLAVLKAAIERQAATGSPAPEGWYRRGLGAAFSANQTADANWFAMGLVKAYPSAKNWGATLAVLREVSKFGPQETLDLMRLMDRTNSWTEERDFVEYIQAADPRRLPGEVLRVVQLGLTSGKLRANDTFVSDAKSQATARQSADKASLASYAADAKRANATEATVTGAADALLSYGEAGQAAELYQSALGKAGVDTARVLTRLGIAQLDQGDFAGAQATFAKVTGPRKAIADLWATYAAQRAKGG